MSRVGKESHHLLYFEFGKLNDIFKMSYGLFNLLSLGRRELDGLKGAHGWRRVDDEHSDRVLVMSMLDSVGSVGNGLTPARSAGIVVCG
jgi:hypothetical protein